jgi:hypothetical protein
MYLPDDGSVDAETFLIYVDINNYVKTNEHISLITINHNVMQGHHKILNVFIAVLFFCFR